MKKRRSIVIILGIISISTLNKIIAQPNWIAIKSNATFNVPDTTYATPYIQPVNVGGWEDGLFISRDGLSLYSLYIPVDIFSFASDFVLNPVCFNFHPYFRPPLLRIDTLSNLWGCPNFIQADIVIATRPNGGVPFTSWTTSNMAMSVTTEGAPQAIPKNVDTADVFVYSRNGNGAQDKDIMFMKNVPNNPSQATAIPIVQTGQDEENPHIERLNDTTLLLLFDRSNYIYYSISNDNGISWQTPILITNVLNDNAPYDVQPHLWNDGTDWWIYFCAPNAEGKHSIYKSKQQIKDDWNSWGPKQLVIEPGNITGGYGTILGVGEPTLTKLGDISFVVIYGDLNSSDTTDVFDADPWFLPKSGSPLSINKALRKSNPTIDMSPSPATEILTVNSSGNEKELIQIYNSIGLLMKETEIQHSTQINISDLPNGLYFIHLKNDSHQTYKFIKQ